MTYLCVPACIVMTDDVVFCKLGQTGPLTESIPPSQFRVFTLGSADLKCDDVIEVCTVPSQFAAPFSTLQIGTSNVLSFLPDFSQLTIDYNYFWLNISHLKTFF